MGKIATDATLQELLTLLRSYLNTQQSTLTGDIGVLANLSTSAKTSLVAAINELVTRTNPLAYNNAGSHNSICRGKKLGSSLTAEQSAAIRAGTFVDIYPGDYWDINVPAYSWTDENGETQNAEASTIRFIVAGCDYLFAAAKNDNLGGWENNHHIVVIPSQPLYTYVMYQNAENTNGGYVNSDMHKYGLKRAEAIFNAAFGESHIYPHVISFCNGAQKGMPVSTMWVKNVKVALMSGIMVYGSSISGLDVSDTICKSQLPYFQSNHAEEHRISSMTIGSYWLRDTYNEQSFSRITWQGFATYGVLTSSRGVLPYAFVH